MDVEKLFKLPKISSSSLNKRKRAEPTQQVLKASHPDPETTTAGPSKLATVTSDNQEDTFAPSNDADYFIDEDTEGRFFGGGLTDQQKRILKIMNRNDHENDVQPETELSNIRRILLRFEKAINKNQEMRVKFANDPRKFIDSEADLDAELKRLVVLTTNPGLFYPELVKIGSVLSLCGLLSHENVDIAAAAIELLEELTDDDVLDAGEDLEDTGMEGMTALINSLLQNQAMDLLVSNLIRYTEEDADAIYHTLGVLENLVSFRPKLAEPLMDNPAYLPWTLEQITKGPFDQNKGYAAEMLAILLHSSERNRQTLGEKQGIDKLLSVLSSFRKRDPADAEETEFMENCFDALCSSLSNSYNLERFHQGEGVELMVILIRSKNLTRLRAIKVLDHALQGSESCETFVECLGLKTLFNAFMGKGTTQEDDEHILGILASLFTNLPSDTASRIRLLAKFVEGEYAKVDRLLELREAFAARVEKVKDADDFERLENGLFALQLTDYCLAWCCMEDDGILAHVKMMLDRNGLSLDAIIDLLKGYHETTDDTNIQEIIVALVNFLLGT